MTAGRRRGPPYRPHCGVGGRKVRAPQDMVVGNAHRPQGPGKCNRKQTASAGFPLKPVAVRVKR